MIHNVRKGHSSGRPIFTLRGFTLIELVVVILVVSLVAAIAVPAYRQIVEKSRAHEAKTRLKAILDAQRRYAFKHDGYASDMDDLDVQFGHEGKFYDFNLSQDAPLPYVTDNERIATASRLGSDLSWGITEMGNIEIVTGCLENCGGGGSTIDSIDPFEVPDPPVKDPWSTISD